MKKAYLLLLPVALFLGNAATAQRGIINTVAGIGIAGFAGDGQAATNAKIDTIGFLAVDDSANIYIADAQNNRIRKVYKQTGIIATIAGTGVAGWTGDYGLAVNANINYPFGIALDKAGNIYFTDNGNGIVRKITKATGVILTIAGTGSGGFTGDDSAATNATFYDPTGIAVDDTGNVYIADDINNCVRVVRVADGNIYLYAGNGVAGFGGDAGPATSAKLNSPEGLSFDINDNLFIADQNNNVIRRVSNTGTISTVAGIQGNNTATDANGPADTIPISSPKDVVCDRFGDIYVSDVGAYLIRQINLPTNTETVVAGDMEAGFYGDGGSAIDAELNYPIGIAVDTMANFYIGDLLNFRIREVTAVVTSVPQISSSGKLEIYPNPTTNTLNILFPASYSSGRNTIEIIDITGRTISMQDKQAGPNTSLSVDVSALSTGMYFVKIADNTNTSSQVFKFIKE